MTFSLSICDQINKREQDMQKKGRADGDQSCHLVLVLEKLLKQDPRRTSERSAARSNEMSKHIWVNSRNSEDFFGCIAHWLLEVEGPQNNLGGHIQPQI